MKVGLVGKPSSGKSTFFSAATLVDVPRAAYPFTTIKPNIGVSYASTDCVCKELNVVCKPRNSKCENGKRLIPITLVDVAGLVPDAHLGKGLGNQFLSDLMEATGLIHIVDLSGKTDEKGESCDKHDPSFDIDFLQKEIEFWLEGILEKHWKNLARKAKSGEKEFYEIIYEQLSGLGMSKETLKDLLKEKDPEEINLFDFAVKIREENKPIILAGNKIDMPSAKDNYEILRNLYDITPVCSEAEFALRRADKEGLIKYVPGNNDFTYLKEANESQKKALDFIKKNVLTPFSGTGVQKLIDRMIFEKLDYITVYPVEDENKLSDKNNNVLPDAYLMKKGSTALDLAFKVHTSIGERFIGAIDARTKRKLGKDYELKNNDVIRILTKN